MIRLRNAVRLMASSVTPTSDGAKVRARATWIARPNTAPAARAPIRRKINDARRQIDMGPPRPRGRVGYVPGGGEAALMVYGVLMLPPTPLSPIRPFPPGHRGSGRALAGRT